MIPVSSPLLAFPDAVLVTVEYLRSALADITVYATVPANTQPADEFVRVERLGGLRNSLITDRPRISIECWSDTQAHAAALMSRVRAYAHAMGGVRGETVVYRVSEVSGPMWLPDAASGHPRYAFAIEFSTRGRGL